MKHFFLFLIFTLPALADQGSILGMARDKKLIEFTEKLTTYCEESHPQILKEKDALLLCYLQLQADAKFSDEVKRQYSLSIKNESKYLENMIISLHGNAAQMTKTHIGSELERIKDPCKFTPSLPECRSFGVFGN